MAEQSPSIEVMEKDIVWSSSIGVTMPVSGAEVYQRVEKIDPALLDNGVLRIQALLKLFAVVTPVPEHKHIFKPAGVFTSDVEINSFINLHADISRQDITSIEHQVIIKNYVPRPDNIIVSGVLKLKISYVVHLVLDGTVTDFASGAPVNGATVNARSLENREIVASTSTGPGGRYFFNNLPPGVYLIEASTDTHRPDQKVSVIKTRDTVNFVLHK
ncbi:MAG: carboxypeptidase-like regulatory domain-containing protein [Peptococcaceae bacterium]|nr:carboxypeptidase-like regulatory domain-containing protein [Peptococcaceae bacterium]